MNFKIMKAYFWYCNGMRQEPTFEGLRNFNKNFGMLFRR
jgi:hypothetical protein